MHFRPFDLDRDFPLLEEFHNRFNPDYHREAGDFRLQEEHRPKDAFVERYVGEKDGEPTCAFMYGTQYWADAPGRRIVEHYTGLDDAADSLKEILDWSYRRMEEEGAKELNAWSRDDRPQVNELLESEGFRLIESQPVSRLDLSTFSPNGFPTEIPGIRLTTIAELEAEGVDWLPDWFEAICEIVVDIPSKQQVTPPPYEEVCEWVANHDLYRRNLMFVALDEGKIVGYSGIRHSKANPDMGETGLSGTLRSHRRRGIVSALKVFALNSARDMGYRRIQTDNLDHNPMFGINQRLGFKTAFSWVHYLKEF